jgi:hypothetical protein
MISVSHLDAKRWPPATSRERTSSWLKSSPFCIAQIEPSSFANG